jgi:large subunit ribosomal protein L29
MANDNAELAELSMNQLVAHLAEAKDEAFKLRFRAKTGQLENTAALTAARRKVARINTFLRQREIAAAEAAAKTEMK